MTLPVEGYQLKRISPKAYEHPADRAATASLQSIPYLDRVVRKLIELGYERALRQAYLGASVRLGEDQLADIWRLQVRAYVTLDLEPVPDLYLTQQLLGVMGQVPNAGAIGSSRPIVVVQSGLLTLLDRHGLYAVLAPVARPQRHAPDAGAADPRAEAMGRERRVRPHRRRRLRDPRRPGSPPRRGLGRGRPLRGALQERVPRRRRVRRRRRQAAQRLA